MYYHDTYLKNIISWEEYRNTWEGGQNFIDLYLKKFSSKESEENFNNRKLITYCPAFAEVAVRETIGPLTVRLSDIRRNGGSRQFNEIVRGVNNGVDLNNNSLTSFVQSEIIPELCITGKVGVFVDMPKNTNIFLTTTNRPYIYTYIAEDILSWAYSQKPKKLISLLLRDFETIFHDNINLPKDTDEVYKYFEKRSNGVLYRKYNTHKEIIVEELLDLEEIPFIILDIGTSLLKNISKYQIALLNLESSDINYCLLSNFPFFVEQYDPYGDASEHRIGNEDEPKRKLGPTQGRRVPKDLQFPTFIAPPSEPLRASIEKGEFLKRDIRLLASLNLKSIGLKSVTEETQKTNREDLEAGLLVIAKTLESFENEFAKFYSFYTSEPVAEIIYPSSFSLYTPEERRKRSEQLHKYMPIVPSQIWAKEIAKQLVVNELGDNLTQSKLNEILQEVDSAGFLSSDAQEIKSDVELGILDLKTAATARGYDPKKVEIAAQEHADRIARIMKSQTDPSARGVNDLGSNPNASKDEKDVAKDKTLNKSTEDTGRGPGR